MEIPTAELAPIRELYGRGLYVQALRAAERFGPLKEWTNTPARLLGGRLAIQLGAARLGRWLHLRAYRETPAHPEAIYYHARYRLERFGPLGAWKFLRSHPDQDWYDAAPEVRADWYGLHAFVCGRLRDFDRADRWLTKAEGMSHDRAWLCVERAAVLEFAERPLEALAAARRSLGLVPDFRPGVQSEAHLLQLLGRESEAMERLAAASERIESGIVVAHLAALQLDQRRYHDAKQSYERYAELSPLRDEETEKWLAARRADTAYYCGDFVAAREQAIAAAEPFYTSLAERHKLPPDVLSPIRLDITKPETGARSTSTLDMIPAYWKAVARPAPTDLNAVDGLQDVRERLWAIENGFIAHEFSVTSESAFELLERGIPFLLTMVDAGYSHSQLVVGCDRTRQSLWLTDANERRTNEAPVGLLVERYAASGPRGLVVIPQYQANRLEGLGLPDQRLYDDLHEIQTALHLHERPAAIAAYERMKSAETGHRVTRLARLAIARYDANPTLLLHAIDSLLALFRKITRFYFHGSTCFATWVGAKSGRLWRPGTSDARTRTRYSPTTMRRRYCLIHPDWKKPSG